MADARDAFRLYLVKRYNLHTFIQMMGTSYGQGKTYLRSLDIGWNNATGELFLKGEKC